MLGQSSIDGRRDGSPPAIEIYVSYVEAARHLPTVVDTLDRLEQHAAGQPGIRRVERQLTDELTSKLSGMSVTPDGRWAVVRLSALPTPEPSDQSTVDTSAR
jgi:hypothetical protein